ncbi:hypothetical protein BGX28_010253 [Mortierella sp. GBA30]|nr:hypothetical protein BGX28_010253 [Mortierella sp. GBA30]
MASDEQYNTPQSLDSGVLLRDDEHSRSSCISDRQERSKHSQQEESQSSDSQAPVKRPNKKHTSADSALRKEQNRAAQRAFRERKERHLNQLENLIKDLKEQQFVITTQFQREVTQLKAYIETILNENHYLREVVFAFEVALSSTGHVAILENVKHQLHRRHHEKQSTTQPESKQHNFQAPTQIFNQSQPGLNLGVPSHVPLNPPHPLSQSVSRISPLQGADVDTTNRDILYKAPPLFVSVASDSGTVTAIAPPEVPLSVPRPSYAPPGTHLPKVTEYTKHPTVFDELQSSLFPPGTLESLAQSSLVSPQEVVDNGLFDELHEDSILGSMHKGTSRFRHNLDPLLQSSFSSSINIESSLKSKATAGSRQDIIFDEPEHRLQMEFNILSQAKPATDPNIDPMIYALPHDSRIDLIPCPKLRAQMILHQHKYNMDELYQLLVDKAICHGEPLDVGSWELPDEFFERFGFLMGLDMERIRRKVWPRKDS